MQCKNDITNERVQCSFDVKSMTHLLDGGERITEKRATMRKLVGFLFHSMRTYTTQPIELKV
jgi:hypothetical protein